MARPANILVELGQYAAVRSLSGLMHCFNVDQNLTTAAGVGSLFWNFSAKHRQRAIENIAASFPEWSRERVFRTAKASVQNMIQVFLVDSLMMPRLITPDNWPQHVRIGPLGPVLERMIRHEPMLLITGHCGNWELLGFALATIGFPIHAIARPLDNRMLNRWLLTVREARGLQIITKFGATPLLQAVLRRGGRLGLIADQNAGEAGLFVPFFGRLASSYKSIGLLAMRYNAAIAAGIATRLNGRFEYEISSNDVITPDDWVDRPDPLFYITARYNRAIERMIRDAPEQYLWVHRRWKSRPKFERDGEPMPGSMIANLESLPWMTQAELDRIVASSNSPVGTPIG